MRTSEQRQYDGKSRQNLSTGHKTGFRRKNAAVAGFLRCSQEKRHDACVYHPRDFAGPGHRCVCDVVGAELREVNFEAKFMLRTTRYADQNITPNVLKTIDTRGHPHPSKHGSVVFAHKHITICCEVVS